jgi:hypothetical protein
MAGSDGKHLGHSLRSDKTSAPRERFVPAFQSERHPFEQTSRDDVGKGMAIHNAPEIRREFQSTRDLSQASEEDCGVRHSRCRRQIVGATGDVGSGCVRCLAPEVRRVLLHARNIDRLRRLAAELVVQGIRKMCVRGGRSLRRSTLLNVLPVVKAGADPSGSESKLPSMRMELNPPRLTIFAPTLIA